MLDALRKAALLGAGMTVMTTEKMNFLVTEMMKHGEMSEKEAREELEDWMDRSKKARKNIEEKTESAVNTVLNGMNIPSQSELR